MHILIFTVCFPPVVNGVSTRYAMTVQNLRKQGHQVTIATPVKTAPEEYFGAKILQVPGFKFALNEFCDSEYLDIYESYSIISKVKPDIVHICAPTWIMFGVLFWCWWKGVPVVSSYHTHCPEYVKYYIGGIIGRWITAFLWWLVQLSQNSSDLTIVTSEVMGVELRQHGITNEMAVWRMGVDTELFHPCKGSIEMRSKLMPDPSKILLLYAGRLSLEKGLPFLAEVMADSRIREKAHLAIVGDGPIRKELETKTFAHLKGCVTIHGEFMAQDQLARAYASSDIFVFPSETETLGLVSIESLASGTPVVGVAARGMLVTVKPGVTGYLYQPGDVAQCVDYVLSLINDSELRDTLSKQARKEAEAWGWERATQHLVGLYTQTIQNSGKILPKRE